jgi:hypothetical protein
MDIFFHRGPVGQPGVGSFTRNFEGRNGAFPSVGALWGKAGGRGYFTGDPEGYVEEGSGDGHLSP